MKVVNDNIPDGKNLSKTIKGKIVYAVMITIGAVIILYLLDKYLKKYLTKDDISGLGILKN